LEKALFRKKKYKKMKKLLLLTLISASAIGIMQSCKKETTSATEAALTVEAKQRSLFVYGTATWCGPCGVTGGPMFKSVIANNSTNDLISLDIHPTTQVGLSYLNPFALKDGNPDSVIFAPFIDELYRQVKPNDYFPLFYCSNSLLGNTGVSAEQVKEFANNYNKNTAPEIGVAASASASGNKINIKYKMKALNPESGSEYFTSVLIIEKSVNAYQFVSPGSHTSLEHKNIVRASAKNTTSGALFGGGFTIPGVPVAFGDAADMINPVAQAEIEKSMTYTYTSPSSEFKTGYNNYVRTQSQQPYDFGWWNLSASNTSVVVIVWKKLSNTEMFYVNAVITDVK
jgi:hypothetical protein